jgi:predicted metal-dependent hydrolase
MLPFAYTLKRSGRRRSVALRVDSGGAVIVSAPLFAPRFWVERVVKQHWPWVLRKQAQFAAAPQRRAPLEFIEGELFPAWGSNLPLTISRRPKLRKAVCNRQDNTLHVELPLPAEGNLKPLIHRAVREWYWRETETRIGSTIQELADRMGVAWKTFKVANQKARWGSCSRQGNLRFNGRLSLFPPEALEYVIVHELAHIKEANHSSRFWAVVEAALPDYKERRKLFRHTALHTLI